MSYIGNGLVIGGLVALVSLGDISAQVKECQAPAYNLKDAESLTITYVANKRADFKSGDYIIGQLRINLKDNKVAERKRLWAKVPDSYVVMKTYRFDRNGDGYEDLIVEIGRPRTNYAVSIDIDDNFDRTFDREFFVDDKGKCIEENVFSFRVDKKIHE